MPVLDYGEPEVREYFCSVGEHWVREYGIDGWRLDVGQRGGRTPSGASSAAPRIAARVGGRRPLPACRRWPGRKRGPLAGTAACSTTPP
ncbi:MAG: alpha-amylase family glycosyl hydrolase [Lachnospiraceae bacterium]